MSDRLVQELGFDAADALAAVTKLDEQFANLQKGFTGLAQTMVSWNTRAESTVRLLSSLASGATSAAEAMTKLMAAFGKQQAMGSIPMGRAPGPNDILVGAGFAGGIPPGGPGAPGAAPAPLEPIKPPIDSKPVQEANEHVKSLTLSWETLGRVVMTQAIVRALSMVRDAAREAMESNITFVRSLTELRAISPEKDLDRISASVVALSKEFNVPLAQVVEAEYQTISNQFTSTAQKADVMRAALEVSKVAMVDAGKAAEIVAGVLNAYGKDSSEAETVTAKLFKTVGEGHIRFADLAQIISRTGPTARELGVSLDELLAAIASLSIGGMKASEVATVLRASMTAAFKPTRDLREEMQGLTTEQSIAMYGLIGAWQKWRGETNGTLEELAKLVPNVRGMGGVVRETGTGVDAFARSLKALKETTAGGLRVEVRLARSTEVERLTDTFNKLKVYLTTELGAGMVSTLNSVIGLVGGVGTLTAALQGLVSLMAITGTSLAALGTIMLAVKGHAALAAGEIVGLRVAVNGLIGALMAIPAGITIRERFIGRQNEVIAGLTALQKQWMAEWKAELDAKNAAQKESDDSASRYAQEMVNKVTVAHQQEIKAAQQANQEWRDGIKIAMDSLVESRERGVRLLRDLANEATREVERSGQRIFDLENARSDWLFHLQQRAKDYGAPGARKMPPI